MPTQEEIVLIKQLAEELERCNITLVQALLPEAGWRLEAIQQGAGQIAAVEHARLAVARNGLLFLLDNTPASDSA